MRTTDLPERAAPLVSVIIPTFERPESLQRAVQSVLTQTMADLEVIVVNDGGGPLESQVAALTADPRVTYVRTGHNGRVAAARNAGLRLARGRFVAYLDDDDVFFPEHLTTLVAALGEGGARLAYSDAVRISQRKEGPGWAEVSRDVPYSRDHDAEQLLLTNYIPTLCILHERACLEEVGMFDETIPVLEDWDLWIRLSRSCAFRHVPVVTCAFHRDVDGSSLSGRGSSAFPEQEARLRDRYRDAIRQSPRARLALYGHLREPADVAMAADDWPRAIALLRGLAADDPDHAAPHADLGLALLRAGDLAGARGALERAVALDPLQDACREALARLLFASGEAAAGLRVIEPAIARHSDNADLLVLGGDLLGLMGALADARALYQVALARSPAHPAALQRIAMLGP